MAALVSRVIMAVAEMEAAARRITMVMTALRMVRIAQQYCTEDGEHCTEDGTEWRMRIVLR